MPSLLASSRLSSTSCPVSLPRSRKLPAAFHTCCALSHADIDGDAASWLFKARRLRRALTGGRVGAAAAAAASSTDPTRRSERRRDTWRTAMLKRGSCLRRGFRERGA
eukprot:2570988-Rhodomonas_salina.1